jgi:pimeloyl-ACP methyl ester carboxylesterase
MGAGGLLLSGLAALLGAAGLVEVLAIRREGRAARATPPTGTDVEVEGARLHVEVMGPETAPDDSPVQDLVLIHGSSGNLRDFTFHLAPRLAKRYRVFAVDRPGLGWSDPHPQGGDIVVQARLIGKAVETLGARRPIVLGQSYGGAVALAWAVTAPESLSGLVLVSAPSFPWETPLGWYYTLTSHPLGQLLAIPLITAFVPGFYVRREIRAVFAPQTAPAGYVDHFGPDLALKRHALRENARQRRHLLEQIRALSPGYHAIQVPVELIHGTADRIVSHVIHSERFAAEHANAHLDLLPGIGHMPHHVAEDAVVAAIDRAALRANVK